MSKQATGAQDVGLRIENRFTDTALAASRQVWLAGLGASSFARRWARDEAHHTFRAWVKQGASVEARVMRIVGKRVNASLATATSLLRLSRDVAATTASALAENVANALPAFRATGPVRRVVASRSRVAAKPTRSRASHRTPKTATRAK